MKILIVDDSEDARDLTEAVLRSAGFTDLRGAASANEAYECLGIGNNPADGAVAADLVLLDIVMPDVDGIEACARIRSNARYNDVPIIMVTSLDDEDSAANAFNAGANGYITKPINRVELIARVRAALRLKAEIDRCNERERE
jgi:sigma-B regulation protein RsbU (phosphoserine phosphatase)